MNYFKDSEFQCKCGKCEEQPVNEELRVVLNDIRQHFGSPTTITSAWRCTEHNTRVGGSSRSQHLLGTAADIQVRGVSPSAVQDYLLEKHTDQYGIGRYSTFTHIDVRDYKARW